ncbi:MAG: oligosaccharide repeat unit polymerase [Bacilli bacterium]|nr:oligosaccharide repeat unit polymerase [Bacilli bacterium]
MKKNVFFYIAYILNLLYIILYRSMIINLPIEVNRFLVLFTYVSFIIKLLLDKYSYKRLLIYILLSLFFLYFYISTGTQYVFVAYLAIICIKDINIKRLLKIDIFIRSFLLLSHFFLFGIDYLFAFSNIENLISSSVKGTQYYLYFSNANIASEMFFSIVIYILYLKNNVKIKDYIISFCIMTLIFYLTRSRTSYIVFIIYILLNIIKNKKLLFYIARYSSILMSIISLYIVKFVTTNSVLYNLYNSLLSNRLLYSILAFKNNGLRIIPYSNQVLKKFIIDNFYVRCFVCYGLIVLLLYIFLNFLAINRNKPKENRLTISMNIYLFFEQVITNIGYNPFLLILANNVINRGDKNE